MATVPAVGEGQAEFRLVLPSDLTESKTNPRRHADAKAFADLVSSVREHGVLVPLLVRPTRNGSFEIVAGARRYRAAKEVGVDSIPVRVRDLTDTQALEIQVIENLQREDVHPLDEATGYQALMKRAGYDVPAIAAKVGKSVSYVYQRLKLAELIEPLKKAFLEDRITAGHAILLARLQSEHQRQAQRECLEDRYSNQMLSVRGLADWIQSNILLDLSGAPWKKDDAELVPTAGPCTTCPKRTGNQPALFPEVKKGDVCTDPTCFAAKMAAFMERKAGELTADGQKPWRLIEGYAGDYDEQTALLKSGAKAAREWVAAKEGSCKHARPSLLVTGKRRGQIVTACAEPRCTTHHGASGVGRMERSAQALAQGRRRNKALWIQTETRKRIFEAVRSKAPAPLARADLEAVAWAFYKRLYHDLKKRLFTVWGLEPVKQQYGGNYDTPVRARLEKFSQAELTQFLMDLSLAPDLEVHPWHSEPATAIRAAAARYRINVKAIEKEVASVAEARFKPKKARKSKPRVQTSAKTKGRSR